MTTTKLSMETVLGGVEKSYFNFIHHIDSRTNFIDIDLVFKSTFEKSRRTYSLHNIKKIASTHEDDFHLSSIFTYTNTIQDILINKNLDVLKDFTLPIESDKEGYLKTLTLIRLLNKLSVSYDISQNFTTSDFWNFVDNGSALNKRFALFHMDYYLFNQNPDEEIDKDRVFSLTQDNSSLYAEYTINKFKLFLDSLMPTIIAIIDSSNALNPSFDEIYSKYAEASNLSKEGLISYLNNAYPRSTDSDTLIAYKLRELWE